MLNSYLHFPDELPYVNLKTLCVCLLFQIQKQPDIFELIRNIGVETHCVDLLKSPLLTPYLHVQLAGFIYYMSQYGDSRKKFTEIAGEKYVEEMFSDMVLRKNPEVQILGVYGVSLVAMGVKSKKIFGGLGVVSGLAAILNGEEGSGSGSGSGGKFCENDKVKVRRAKRAAIEARSERGERRAKRS